MTDYNLLTFKAISSFTNDLSDNFGGENHELKLYQRLLNKTTLSHEVAITKHIDAFKQFCVANRDALLSKRADKLVSHKIEYSSRVFIDIHKIFKSSDKETAEIIWKHLLTISAFVDPAGKAKEILKKTSAPSNETNFLENIINKVEANVDPHSKNPLEAVNNLMSSGVFNEVLSGMNNDLQNGSLDLNKLMGTVEKMCSTLLPPQTNASGTTEPVNLAGLFNTFAPLLSTLGNSAGQSGAGGIDVNSIMTQMMNAQSSKTVLEEIKKDT